MGGVAAGTRVSDPGSRRLAAHRLQLKFERSTTERPPMKYRELLTRLIATGAGDSFFNDDRFDSKRVQDLRRKAIDKVREVGLPVVENTSPVFQWDGATLSVGEAGQKENSGTCGHPSNILHDLAHWAVCTSKKRRVAPDFGLGTGPSSSDRSDSTAGRATQPEEERASLLGILMELELGMPAADTMRLHNWANPPWAEEQKPVFRGPDGTFVIEEMSNFTRTLEWLIKRNFIDEKGAVDWAQVSKGACR